MTSLFDRLLGKKDPSSADIAKERLKLVLVSDRSDLPQERLAEMQAEILEVIKRYVAVEELEVEIKVEQRERKNYLVADIPLQRDRSYAVASQNAPLPPATPDSAAPVSSDDTQPTQAAPNPGPAVGGSDEDGDLDDGAGSE